MGVNEIFISSLTVRNRFQAKIDKINHLLRQKAAYFPYKFIDNNNIDKTHLSKDGLHLRREGTIILANNFLNALNEKSIFDSWY